MTSGDFLDSILRRAHYQELQRTAKTKLPSQQAPQQVPKPRSPYPFMQALESPGQQSTDFFPEITPEQPEPTPSSLALAQKVPSAPTAEQYPEKPWWQAFTPVNVVLSALDTLMTPFTWLNDHADKPWAGAITLAAQRIFPGQQQLESEFDKARESGESWYDALRHAYEKSDIPWYARLALETTNPIYFLPYGRIVQPLARIGAINKAINLGTKAVHALPARVPGVPSVKTIGDLVAESAKSKVMASTWRASDMLHSMLGVYTQMQSGYKAIPKIKLEAGGALAKVAEMEAKRATNPLYALVDDILTGNLDATGLWRQMGVKSAYAKAEIVEALNSAAKSEAGMAIKGLDARFLRTAAEDIKNTDLIFSHLADKVRSHFAAKFGIPDISPKLNLGKDLFNFWRSGVLFTPWYVMQQYTEDYIRMALSFTKPVTIGRFTLPVSYPDVKLIFGLNKAVAKYQDVMPFGIRNQLVPISLRQFNITSRSGAVQVFTNRAKALTDEVAKYAALHEAGTPGAKAALEYVQSELDFTKKYLSTNDTYNLFSKDMPPVQEPDTWYHGSKQPIDKFATSYEAPGKGVENLFGEGLYLTDNPSIAGTYAKGQGIVYSTKLRKDLNLLDLEKPLPSDAQEAFINFAKYNDTYLSSYTHNDVTKWINDGVPGVEIYNRLAKDIQGMPKSEATEAFGAIVQFLQSKGYEGFSHVGGKYAGKGKTLHNVRIVWEPEKAITKKEVYNPSYSMPYPQDLTKVSPIDPWEETHYGIGTKESSFERIAGVLFRPMEWWAKGLSKMSGADIAGIIPKESHNLQRRILNTPRALAGYVDSNAKVAAWIHYYDQAKKVALKGVRDSGNTYFNEVNRWKPLLQATGMPEDEVVKLLDDLQYVNSIQGVEAIIGDHLTNVVPDIVNFMANSSMGELAWETVLPRILTDVVFGRKPDSVDPILAELRTIAMKSYQERLQLAADQVVMKAATLSTGKAMPAPVEVSQLTTFMGENLTGIPSRLFEKAQKAGLVSNSAEFLALVEKEQAAGYVRVAWGSSRFLGERRAKQQRELLGGKGDTVERVATAPTPSLKAMSSAEADNLAHIAKAASKVPDDLAKDFASTEKLMGDFFHGMGLEAPELTFADKMHHLSRAEHNLVQKSMLADLEFNLQQFFHDPKYGVNFPGQPKVYAEFRASVTRFMEDSARDWTKIREDTQQLTVSFIRTYLSHAAKTPELKAERVRLINEFSAALNKLEFDLPSGVKARFPELSSMITMIGPENMTNKDFWNFTREVNHTLYDRYLSSILQQYDLGKRVGDHSHFYRWWNEYLGDEARLRSMMQEKIASTTAQSQLDQKASTLVDMRNSLAKSFEENKLYFAKESLAHAKASEVALSAANGMMGDYESMSELDRMMTKIFPFWYFPSRSIPFYLRTGLEKPWTVAAINRYEQQSKSDPDRPESLWGYIKVPIPGDHAVYINPLRPFMGYQIVDTNAMAGKGQTPVEQGITASRMLGFGPNPFITNGLEVANRILSASGGPAITRGNPTPLFPQWSWLQSAIAASTGHYTPEPISGLISGTEMPDWYQRNIEKQLAAKQSQLLQAGDTVGAAKYDLSTIKSGMQRGDEESTQIWKDALSQIGSYGLYSIVLPIAKFRTAQELQMRVSESSALKDIGFTDSQLKQIRDAGLNPWSYLNRQQRRAVNESHPEWLPFRYMTAIPVNPNETKILEHTDKFFSSLEAARRDYQPRLDSANEALRLRIIAPRQWREIFQDNQQKVASLSDFLLKEYPLALVTQERIDAYRTKYGRPIPSVHPEDMAVDIYNSIQPENDPETGAPDLDSFEYARDDFLAALPDTIRKYVESETIRSRTGSSIEAAYRADKLKMRPYRSITRNMMREFPAYKALMDEYYVAKIYEPSRAGLLYQMAAQYRTTANQRKMQLRTINGEIEAMLYYWGYVSELINPNAVDYYVKLVERLR